MVHACNLRFLEKNAPAKTGHGFVYTADDASYLVPVENFLEKGTWKDNSQGLSSYIQRPPGMGIIHGIFLLVWPGKAFFMQKVFCCMLHGMALYLLGLVAWSVSGNKKIAMLAQFVYALWPACWGYLSYFLTESVTPSLMVIFLYASVRYYQDKKTGFLFLQAAAGGFLLCLRPQLGIFLLPFVYFLAGSFFSGSLKKRSWSVICFLVCFGGFLGWQMRSSMLGGKFTDLHPVYSTTNNTQYRPVHQSFGELFKTWEYEGENFHGVMTAVWNDALTNGKGSIPIPDFTEKINLQGCKGITKPGLQELLAAYKKTIGELQFAIQNRESVPGETTGEKELRQKMDELTARVRSRNPGLYYIKTPARSFIWMFSKSQLNLALFQQKYRGELWMETLRWTSVSLIFVSFLSMLLTLYKPANITWFLFSVSACIYLFYLFFFQRMNEERYLLPLLPFMFLCTLPFMGRLVSFLQSKTAYPRGNMP